MFNVAHSLARCLQDHNGEMRTNAMVSKILVGNAAQVIFRDLGLDFKGVVLDR